MNFLAHAWLARRGSDAFLYGNLIADGVKGASLDDWPVEVALGIRHHRRVDAHVDHHPCIVAARSRAPAGTRRYAGIALDLVWDHFLARRLSADDELFPRCYRLLAEQPAPARLAAMVPVMVQQDWLRRYADWHFTCRALEGLGQRLEQRLNQGQLQGATRRRPEQSRLAALIPWLNDDYQALGDDFASFWPELGDALEAAGSGSTPSG
ncbi:MAG TPA: ACP phosphodiesterase [Halomonas sp.]|nr:ACP phosphodiesterase [Halomonas sp.]